MFLLSNVFIEMLYIFFVINSLISIFICIFFCLYCDITIYTFKWHSRIMHILKAQLVLLKKMSITWLWIPGAPKTGKNSLDWHHYVPSPAEMAEDLTPATCCTTLRLQGLVDVLHSEVNPLLKKQSKPLLKSNRTKLPVWRFTSSDLRGRTNVSLWLCLIHSSSCLPSNDCFHS